MRCFKATVEYDGTELHGFQYQVGQRTVQGDLESALEVLTGSEVRVHGAGRTDAGVHALGQVVGFRAETRIPIERIPAAMNSLLARDIRVVGAEEVDETFHARFSARSRTYVYVLLNREHPSAVFGRYCWHVAGALDVEAMAEGAHRLQGTRDFRAWANETREVESSVREVKRCAVRPVRGFVLVRVEANAFLRGMVRNIVGTLVQIGQGKRRPEEIDEITASLQRENAGPSAPAQGLCLVRVLY
jgi:tRNA pseudouridine38-40 synthase